MKLPTTKQEKLSFATTSRDIKQKQPNFDKIKSTVAPTILGSVLKEKMKNKIKTVTAHQF